MSRDPAAGPANRLPAAKAVGDGHPEPVAFEPAPRGTPHVMPDERGRAAGQGRGRAGTHPSGESGRRGERPRLELTGTQIGAGVAAALTSALLGSGLGVAGTVVGAGVGSAISITAGALYSHSIAATRHRLRRARDGAGTHRSPAPPPEPPVVAVPARSGRVTTRRHGRSLLAGVVGAALAFALSLVLITGIESVKGAPLAGGQPGGLTVLGGDRVAPPARAPRTSVPATTGATSTASRSTGTSAPTKTSPVRPGSRTVITTSPHGEETGATATRPASTGISATPTLRPTGTPHTSPPVTGVPTAPGSGGDSVTTPAAPTGSSADQSDSSPTTPSTAPVTTAPTSVSGTSSNGQPGH